MAAAPTSGGQQRVVHNHVLALDPPDLEFHVDLTPPVPTTISQSVWIQNPLPVAVTARVIAGAASRFTVTPAVVELAPEQRMLVEIQLRTANLEHLRQARGGTRHATRDVFHIRADWFEQKFFARIFIDGPAPPVAADDGKDPYGLPAGSAQDLPVSASGPALSTSGVPVRRRIVTEAAGVDPEQPRGAPSAAPQPHPRRVRFVSPGKQTTPSRGGSRSREASDAAASPRSGGRGTDVDRERGTRDLGAGDMSADEAARQQASADLARQCMLATERCGLLEVSERQPASFCSAPCSRQARRSSPASRPRRRRNGSSTCPEIPALRSSWPWHLRVSEKRRNGAAPRPSRYCRFKPGCWARPPP
jgi:hypothetical protein